MPDYLRSRKFAVKTLRGQPGKEFLTVLALQSVWEFLLTGAIRMDLLVSRIYPFIDSESLVEYRACDTLFRTADGGFLLHLSSLNTASDVDRLVWIDCRAALVWINEGPDEFGKEWE
ncbi:hypothetical protein [Bradyrhizobium canariense]|uniref:hypothetical protein n=1 Tax=Bradyrhizobium canariense TaxID=255045 RepID=UPI000C2460E2|nr:hypothetical protein [Bradyrhizobium canariense]